MSSARNGARLCFTAVVAVVCFVSLTGCTRLFLTLPNPQGSSAPCNPCLSDRSPTTAIVSGTVTGDAITVDAAQRFQTIGGFGFTLTDTSAALIDQVPNDAGQRDALMQQLFDPDKGIGVSWVRIVMGASDFTVVPRPWYSYRPTEADAFDIGRARPGSPNGDFSHIIPILQQAQQISKGRVTFFANPHSAPAWMKANDDMWNVNGDGCILGYCPNSATDVRDQYAQYFVDFIKSYEAAGIPIHAVGVQNEPGNMTDYPGGVLLPGDQLDFISRLKALMASQSPPLQTQVWGEFGDWEAASILNRAQTPNDVDGLSYHCYLHNPPNLDAFHAAYPTKSINETECTQDVNATWPKTIELLLQDTGHWANVVANWNLALDPDGGPQATCNSTSYDTRPNRAAALAQAASACTTHGSTMTAPVVISNGGASMTREYYEMGQFSKFVHPGAVRIGSTALASVTNVAFQNTDGSRVLVVHNNRTSTVNLGVNVDSTRHFARVDLAPDEIATFTW